MNKNCRAKQGAGAGDPGAWVQEHGHGLATELDARGGVIGQRNEQDLLFETYDGDRDGDLIWLARAVADAKLGGRCCKRVRKRALLQ